MSKNCPIMKRMKENYEGKSNIQLTRRIPVIMRIDGNCFSKYTKNLNTPFDTGFIEDMDSTAIFLCEKIQGAKCAYVQSDEISILLTDYDKLNTSAWFDYKTQKMCSIAAGMATAKFNALRKGRELTNVGAWGKDLQELFSKRLAWFDARADNYPREEVPNYFVARQRDAVKNSIHSLALSLYSHSALHKKNQSQMQDLIHEKGHNWNDLPFGQKRGRFIVKNKYFANQLVVKETAIHIETKDYLYEKGSGRCHKIHMLSPDIAYDSITIRTKWEVVETPMNFNHEHFKQWL